MQMSRRAAAAAIAAAAIAAAAALVAAAHSRRARVGTPSDRRPAADAPRPRPLARAPPPASRTPGGVAWRRGGNECLCQSAPWGDGFLGGVRGRHMRARRRFGVREAGADEA